MNALYNEIEPFACNWLDELIRRGHIAPGRVERRGISDLTADDVTGPGQRHFFAGIGGWNYALRLAGVRDDANIWTGSCPCQPFSSAGKGLGVRDPRHLWPAWFALIEQCRPPIIFGEQVASKDGLVWLDLVFSDLERCGYSVGAADLCAAGVGAPHIRQRLYFVAYANEAGRSELGIDRLRKDGDPQSGNDTDGRGANHVWLAEPEGEQHNGRRFTGERRPESSDRCDCGHQAGQHDYLVEDCNECSCTYYVREPAAVFANCTDGKRRPVPTEPALFPLAHGVPNRVGTLRGSGNAIVPQLAATFIRASLEAIGEVT